MKRIILYIFLAVYSHLSINLLRDIIRNTSFEVSDTYFIFQFVPLFCLALLICYFLRAKWDILIVRIVLTLLIIVYLVQFFQNSDYYVFPAIREEIDFYSHRNDTPMPANPRLFLMGFIFNVYLIAFCFWMKWRYVPKNNSAPIK